jgi:hypothetical protein
MKNKIILIFGMLLIFLFSITFLSAGNGIVCLDRNIYKIQIIKNIDMLPGDSLESPDESFFLEGEI